MIATLVEIFLFAFYWSCDLIKETYYFLTRSRPQKEIKNENILITGSGQGLGRLVSHKLAKDGNILHCVDINMDLNQKLKEELKDNDCTVYVYKCDVSEIENVRELGRQIKESTPDRHISYLFNIAGIVMGKTFGLETEEEMKKVISVNVLALMYLQKLVYDGMVANYGHIINISSLAGLVHGPMIVDYCTSKFAVTGLSRSLISELEYRGINNVKITSVHPHIITTGMFNNVKAKWPRIFPLLEPEWVAEEIVKATREEKEQVVLPKITNLFLPLEYLMSTKIFRLYTTLLGNDAMKDFIKIRTE